VNDREDDDERGDDDDSPDFTYTELKPEDPNVLLYTDTFSVFLVQVKSESDEGRDLHNDPIEFFRRRAPKILGGEENVRAMMLRANAERSANPHHRSEVWTVIPDGSKTAVGVQYKYDRDMREQGGEEATS
jgi:hypothetical protein